MQKPGAMSRILYRLSARLPCRVIMEGETPYLERYFLFKTPASWPLIGGVQAYLHRFVASDPDRGQHNHPWGWARSLVLAGGYLEERIADFNERGFAIEIHARRPGRINRISGGDFHRVVLPDGSPGAWSLFVHGPYRKGWGFLRLNPPSGEGAFKYYAFTTADQAKSRDAMGGGTPWWRTAPLGRDCDERVPAGGLTP